MGEGVEGKGGCRWVRGWWGVSNGVGLEVWVRGWWEEGDR